MSFDESKINSKILANHFRELSVDFTPPYKKDNMWINYRIFETNNHILYFLSQIDRLIKEGKCDSDTFKKDIIRITNLHLELIWYLEISGVVTLTEYFEFHDENEKLKISEEIYDGIINWKKSKFKQEMIYDCIKQVFRDMRINKNTVLCDSVFNIILHHLNVKEGTDVIEDKILDFSELLELFEDSSLRGNTIKNFCICLCNHLFEGRTETIKSVLKKQESLKNNVKSTKIFKILNSITKYCEVNEFMELFEERIFNKFDQTNWEFVLSFVTFIGCHYNDGWSLLKALSVKILKESFISLKTKLLLFAFIIPRQGCFERPNNIFPSYLQWFSSTFSSDSRRPINTKQICNFFFNFLSDLVPYDPPYYSKVHINRTAWVPADCQYVLSDYIILVKTQLSDLNVSCELGIFENTSGKSAAVYDVDNVIKHFEKTNEILSSVFQAAMFCKEYYEKKFLVELLSKFDGKKSSRHKLIMKLHSAGKIPNGMYKNYKSLEKNK